MFAVFPLFSQEDTPEHEGRPEPKETALEDSGTDHPPSPPPDNDKLYVITTFEFDIKGRTRPFALIYNSEFKNGEKIKGQANLDAYIRDKTQILINQRVLKDNAVISHSVGEQEADGSYPVTLTISVEDTWNIIALPKPEYSSNTGFELTIKARDYNFMGTMNPLRIDLGYRYDEKEHSSFQFEVYSGTPFNALGYTWNLRFDNLFWYRPDVEEPFYYKNITGLSMELPFRTTTFTFGFEEYFNVNQENSSRQKEVYHVDFQNGLYMASTLYTSWKIPTGLLVSRYGELTYTPSISATFNHEFPDWPLLSFRRGPFLNFSHSLGFGRTNWHENYREGFSASVSNGYSYDFFRLDNDKEPLSTSLVLSGTGHFIISKFFGISSRLQYRHWFYHDPDYYEQAGDNLRGIIDKAICADYMLSLNMDFPFRVLLFTPSRWFNNRKLNFFDLEFHISPVIDLALCHDPQTETSFHPRNTLASGGLELIVFSDFMRNLYARLSVAWNLRELFTTGKLPDGNNREISFVLGHFY